MISKLNKGTHSNKNTVICIKFTQILNSVNNYLIHKTSKKPLIISILLLLVYVGIQYLLFYYCFYFKKNGPFLFYSSLLLILTYIGFQLFMRLKKNVHKSQYFLLFFLIYITIQFFSYIPENEFIIDTTLQEENNNFITVETLLNTEITNNGNIEVIGKRYYKQNKKHGTWWHYLNDSIICVEKFEKGILIEKTQRKAQTPIFYHSSLKPLN